MPLGDKVDLHSRSVTAVSPLMKDDEDLVPCNDYIDSELALTALNA